MGNRFYTTPVAERFAARVDRQSGPIVRPSLGRCWLWTGARIRNGYGHLWVTPSQQENAHRVAWRLANAPEGAELADIPPGGVIRHRCDVPLCVRPSHLLLGSYQDNADDAVARDRVSHGERHPGARLTEERVGEIRARYAEGGISQRQLAAEFGVCQSVVSEIVNRKAWRRAA